MEEEKLGKVEGERVSLRGNVKRICKPSSNFATHDF
jgi:hypothetical protein